MIRKMLLASVLAFGTAGAALAQDGSGTQPATGGAASIGNVVGGGEARVIGGGDDATVVYTARSASQAGRLAQATGGTGDGTEVQYLAPVPAGERGRSALLLGSGEDAAIVYFDALGRYHG